MKKFIEILSKELLKEFNWQNKLTLTLSDLSQMKKYELQNKCADIISQLQGAIEVDIFMRCFYDGKNLIGSINRARFEYIIDDIIDETFDNLSSLLDDCYIEESDITFGCILPDKCPVCLYKDLPDLDFQRFEPIHFLDIPEIDIIELYPKDE